MANRIKEFRVLIVCTVIAIVIFIANSIVSNVVYTKNLTVQEENIQQLMNKYEMNRVSKQQAVDDTKAKVTGIDNKRVKTDDGILDAFLKDCFTWSSADEYNAIRKKLADSNVLADNGTFLNVLFPELVEKQDIDGNATNDIDNSIYGQLNLKYDSMKSHVTDIKDGVYSYFTEVTVTSAVKGGTSSTGDLIVTYSVDKDGNLSNVDAYTVAQ